MASNDVTPPKRTAQDYTWQTLIEFTLSREPGNEYLVAERVAEVGQRLNWPEGSLERLQLTVARATQNLMERSHLTSSEASLIIRVLIPEGSEATQASSQVSDNEPGQHQVSEWVAQPASRPLARGWGFFMIEKAGPDSGHAGQHLLELFLYPGGK